MTKDLSSLVKRLGIDKIVEYGGRVQSTAPIDDDINLSSIRQTGLDYSDFDGNQINDGASNAR